MLNWLVLVPTLAAVAAGAAAPAQPTMEPKVDHRPRLMSAERDAHFRQFFPRVDQAALRRILADPRLLIYTEAEMPKAYQFFDGAFPGVHNANYNISANHSEPFGNGNREFPWSHPAGTHRTNNLSSFRFLWLPRDAQGVFWPVVWYKNPGYSGGYSWTFPVGTVLGEVLAVHGPDGRDYTFELRTRTRDVGSWDVDVFRPFPTAADLEKRIKQLRPEWQANTSLVQFCSHLDDKHALPVGELADRQPRVRTFQQTMGIDELPALDEKLVMELLTTTPFRSALGRVWRSDAQGVTTCAPTTSAAFHIVPTNYDAGFIALDSQSCMRCHSTTNQPVRTFDAGRDWYGRIRGSDGIFSFHPFAPHSISGNGYAAGVQMRSELISAGVIAEYNSQIHVASKYQSLEGSR